MERRNKKKFMSAALSAVMITSAFTGTVQAEANYDPDQVVVTLNSGEGLTLGTLAAYIRFNQAETYSYYEYIYSMFGAEMQGVWDYPYEDDEETEAMTEEADDSGNTRDEQQTVGDYFRDETVKTLTEDLLAKQHMEEYGVEITEEESEEISAAAKEYVSFDDGKWLEEDGYDEKDVETFINLEIIKDRVEEAVEAEYNPEITDEEARQSTITYVTVSPSDFESQENESESVETEEESEKDSEADEKARSAAEQVALLANDDPSSLEENASSIDSSALTSTYSFGPDDDSYDLEDSIMDQVKELSDNEILGPVQGSDGSWYIVRMDKVEDTDAEETKRQELIQEAKEEHYNDTVETWKSADSISYNWDLIDLISVNDSVIYKSWQEEAESETDIIYPSEDSTETVEEMITE